MKNQNEWNCSECGDSQYQPITWFDNNLCGNCHNKIKYPFSEGDDYWTIEDGVVTWSCWDYVSEELFDMNPSKKYFTSEESANDYLKSITL